MNARLARKFELYIDRAASALLAGAVGYAAFVLAADTSISALFAALLGGAAGYCSSSKCLALLAGRPRDFKLSVFNVADIPDGAELLLTNADRMVPDELLLTESDRLVDELLLTEADRLIDELVLTDVDRLRVDEPLILDDIAEAVGPGSRVVQLFDRRAMPNPGELQSNIDKHIARPANHGRPDAAQELSAALAELRKALR